jgi:hypothetical protein
MANMVNDHIDWAYVAGEDSLQDGNVETEEFNDCLKRDRRDFNVCLAGKNGSPGFQETAPLCQLGEEIKEGKNEGIVKESQNKKGKDIFYFGAVKEQNLDNSTKAKEVIPPRKYVGQWDSVLNQMTWSCLKEGENIQLVKDSKTDSYFPRVNVVSTQSSDSYQPQQGLTLSETSQSTCLLKDLDDKGQNSLRRLVGSKPTWKKRARAQHDLDVIQTILGESEGKRMQTDREKDDQEDNAKKGRKIQAVAASQHRPQP